MENAEIIENNNTGKVSLGCTVVINYEDDELDKTRKIDFSNKNEVYQDFFDEKKKSKLTIVIVVIFVLLLIGVICYFVYVNR